MSPADDESYVVTRGIWTPPGGNASTVDLATFLRRILDRTVVLRDIPPGPATVARREWVREAGLPVLAELEDRERQRRAVAPASATTQVVTVLSGGGLAPARRVVDGERWADATVVGTKAGDVAVHPRPGLVEAHLARLAPCRAVVVPDDRDRRALVAAGLDPARVLDPPGLEALVVMLAQRRNAERVLSREETAPLRQAGGAPRVPPQAAVAAPPPARRDGRRRRRWLRLLRRRR